ncbi:MAG: FAD-dependent monooxygenase [Burkholderiaceae bacterium]
MNGVRDIAIVGAGLAGLACALSAAAAGASVQVFESAAAPADPPAHIDVVPNLLRDLATLGVGDACLQRGFVHQGVRVVDCGSGAQWELPAARLAGERYPPALGLRYGVLLGLLADAARERGVQLRWGAPVRAIDAPHGRVELGDGRHCRFDLVLLAGGAGALPALAPWPAAALPAAAMQVWYALLPRPAELDRSTWFIGPGARKTHLVPVALDRAGVAVSRPAAPLHARPVAASRAASLRALLCELPAPLPALAGHLRNDDAVAVRAVRSALQPRPWHRGALLAVGDAAHALPPHLGQAAAQSVEDAVVLGQLLRDAAPREVLLERFEARRYARAAQVHALATQAARWDQAPAADTDLHGLHEALWRVVSTAA